MKKMISLIVLFTAALATATTTFGQSQGDMKEIVKMFEALAAQQTQPVVLRDEAIPAHIKAIMPGEFKDGSYTDYGMGQISFTAESRIKKSFGSDATFRFSAVVTKPGIIAPSLLPLQKAQLQEEFNEKANELREKGQKPTYVGTGSDSGLVITYKTVEIPGGVIHVEERKTNVTEVFAQFVGLVELTQFDGSVGNGESAEQAVEFGGSVAGIAINAGK